MLFALTEAHNDDVLLVTRGSNFFRFWVFLALYLKFQAFQPITSWVHLWDISLFLSFFSLFPYVKAEFWSDGSFYFLTKSEINVSDLRWLRVRCVGPVQIRNVNFWLSRRPLFCAGSTQGACTLHMAGAEKWSSAHLARNPLFKSSKMCISG